MTDMVSFLNMSRFAFSRENQNPCQWMWMTALYLVATHLVVTLSKRTPPILPVDGSHPIPLFLAIHPLAVIVHLIRMILHS